MKHSSLLLFLVFNPLIFLMAESPDLETQILENIFLEHDNGKKWDSSILKGKITLLVYFDPVQRDKGKIFMPTLEAFESDLDFTQFQTILIVNLKATLISDFLINTVIKNQGNGKRERF